MGGRGNAPDGGGGGRRGAEDDDRRNPANPAWTARGRLLLEFHDAISRAINGPGFRAKCDAIGRSMAEAEGRGGDVAGRSSAVLRDYRAEADKIIENKAIRDGIVRNKSLAVGAVSFIALRSTRGLVSWMKAAVARRKASYKFDIPPSKTEKSAATASQPSFVERPSRGRHLFWLSCDAALSTGTVFLSGTFLFMPPPSSFLRDMADLPLVAGKSVYAEHVCPPLLRDYRRVVERHGGWPVPTSPAAGLTREDASLNVIRRFVSNCAKRKRYEAALDDERNAMSLRGGKSKLGTVYVPEPGVPDEGIDLEREVLAERDSEMP